MVATRWGLSTVPPQTMNRVVRSPFRKNHQVSHRAVSLCQPKKTPKQTVDTSVFPPVPTNRPSPIPFNGGNNCEVLKAPTKGSVKHHLGNCKPCAFVFKARHFFGFGFVRGGVSWVSWKNNCAWWRVGGKVFSGFSPERIFCLDDLRSL